MSHNAHGFLHGAANDRLAHFFGHTVQKPSSGSITINTDNAARHHHAPRRGIDHKTIVIFDVFFPVSDAHFIVDKRISGVIVWHPNQGFCQTHEQDTFLGIKAIFKQ